MSYPIWTRCLPARIPAWRVTFFVIVLSTGFLGGSPRDTVLVEKPELGMFFSRHNVTGSFLLFDESGGRWYAYRPARCMQRFIPASTFKIFNSLVALETGVIPDEESILRWDGVKRHVEEWNRDQNMHEAFKFSTVWFYQELARRIGQVRMQHFIDSVAYGNRDISGAIDSFWLTGHLRISQREQIDFLRRLHQGDLPFSPRTLRIVHSILLREEATDWKLFAKTGWGTEEETEIGWYVGYVETPGSVYYFATNIETPSPGTDDFPRARIEITRAILKDMGILKNIR